MIAKCELEVIGLRNHAHHNCKGFSAELLYSKCLSSCPYCSFTPEDAWILNDDVVAMPHPSPLASCHVVVAPRRHVAEFYDLDVGEQRQIWEVLGELVSHGGGATPRPAFSD